MKHPIDDSHRRRGLPPLNALRAFETAARLGSFTRAAEVLHVTQSAVSRQVRLLEDVMGEPLLVREHHHLELTAAGRALLPVLEQAFDGIEATVRGIRVGQPAARLRINLPPTFARRWFLPRLAGLRTALPALDLTLTSQVRDDLADNPRLDCAIRFGSGDWPGLHSRLLFNEAHIAVCHPALLPGDDPAALAAATLLHVTKPAGRYLTWQHWLAAAGLDEVDAERGLEFDALDLAIAAAYEGVGITIADRHMVAAELADGRLVQWTATVVPGTASYWFVTRERERDGGQARALWEWLREQAEAAPPQPAIRGNDM